MPTKNPHTIHRKNLPVIAAGVVTSIVFFGMGVRSAHEIQTVGSLRAADAAMTGDLSGDGTVTIADALIALDIIQDYAPATPQQRKDDPNGDGAITIQDLRSILHYIEQHP